MNITRCTPLPGQGLIARYGDLVAVTDGRGPGPDPLLGALAEVAAAAGDGSELVRTAARAALGSQGQPAWVCAGVTADGGVAVLVHGHAVAVVRVAGAPDVTLTASDSVIPVSRTFAGPVVVLDLAVGEPAAPDPRCWLGGGVVPGGGLRVTVSADVDEPAGYPADGQAPGTVLPAMLVPEALMPDVLIPGVPAPGVPAPDELVPDGPRPGGLAPDGLALDGFTPDGLMPGRLSPAGPPEVAPTVVALDAAHDGRRRDEQAPAAATADEDWLTGQPSAGPVGWHPPTVVTPTPGPPAAEDNPAENGPPPVLVEGVLCGREHFNDPDSRTCRQCGSSLDEQRRNFQRRERPPLGVLVFDDGTRITLDGDYVLGREPALDGDVVAGRARPLRITDPEGTVSRLHLRISLVRWQVEVSDLGSANGSVLQSSGGERTLAPFEPTVVEPGAWIGIGHRSMQYLAYQGVLP
jgi:hypothetical protein